MTEATFPSLLEDGETALSVPKVRVPGEDVQPVTAETRVRCEGFGVDLSETFPLQWKTCRNLYKGTIL